MKQCWKEKADERSCYSSFLHIFENLYSSDATGDITYVSLVMLRYLKYAPLEVHVYSFGNRFRKIRILRKSVSMQISLVYTKINWSEAKKYFDPVLLKPHFFMNNIFQFILGWDICDRIMYVCTNSIVTFNHFSRKTWKKEIFTAIFSYPGIKYTSTKNNKLTAKQLIS